MSGTMPELDGLTTVLAGAREVGVSPATVANWLKAGKLDAAKFGRDWVLRREDLQRVAAESEQFYPGQRRGGKASAARRWQYHRGGDALAP